MKLKTLKLRNATVLNNSQMKAVWGRNGYGDPYDDPIYDGGYLPEVEIVCNHPGEGRGRCFTIRNFGNLFPRLECVWTGFTVDECWLR